MEKKNSASTNKKAEENLHFYTHTIFLVKLQCSILDQPLSFLHQKDRQMKTGQNNK